MDRGLLGRATEGTDAPTPGYLYMDLAKAATANPTACADMAQYLTRKLQNKQNPNVKAKCCKVIAKLCEQVPRNQFRRCVAQDAQAVAAIKEAINYRGGMDPLQGDAKNERVRAAAREALEAVYKESPSSEQPMQAMSGSYGASPHAGGGGGYMGGGGGAMGYQGGGGGGGGTGSDFGSRRMEGIGNPMYSDPRNDPRFNNGGKTTFQETMREAGEVVKGMIMDPLARNVGTIPNQGHSGNLPGYGPSHGHGPPGASELSRQTGGQWTMASNRGPAAIGGGLPATSEYHKERDTGFNSWNNNNPSAGGGGATLATAGVPGGSWGSSSLGVAAANNRARESGYGTPSVNIVAAPSSHAGTTTGPAAGPSDGSYEKNLVLELCPPGGVKPVPPPDKLAAFARSVSNLNSELICPVLLDFLEDGQPWVIRAKALCVMETAIQNGVVVANGTNPYKAFFFACSEEIQPLSVHPRAAIAEPAKRVLLLLGITPGTQQQQNDQATVAAAAPVPAPPAAAAPNLLDFDDVDNNAASTAPPLVPPPPPPTHAPPPPPPPTAAAATTVAPTNNMFGGMTVKGGGAPVAAAPPPAAPPTTAAAPAAAPPGGSGLLDFSSSDPFAPQPEATTVSTMASQQHVTAPAPPSTAAAAPAATSMFGQLSIKDEKKKEDDAPVASATGSSEATSSSAFGFINNSAPAAAAAAPTPVAAAPTAPEPNSFDPLQNLAAGGGTASHSAQSSSSPSLSPAGMSKVMMTLSTEQMQAMAYQQMMMQQQMQQMQMAAMMAQQQRGGMPAPPPMAMQFRQASGTMTGTSSSSAGFNSGYQPAKKDDKKFDFVKDAMVSAEKKK